MSLFTRFRAFFSRLSPVFLLGAAFFLLAPLAAGGLFTPYETPSALGFDGQRADLESALLQAMEEKDALPEGADTAPSEQKIRYYQTALSFSLSVWEREFDADGATLYTEISLRAENAEGEEKEKWEGRLAALSSILQKRDEESFLSLYREYLTETLGDPSKADTALENARLRYAVTEDGVATPGENALVSQIVSLKKSVEEKRDLYHPVHQKNTLDEEDILRFSALATYWEDRLAQGKIDPLPANGETLSFLEGLLSFLLFCFLLFSAQGETSPKKALLRLSWQALFFVGVLSLSLTLTAALFAPGSLTPFSLFWGTEPLSLPFYPALLLRLLLRFVGYLLPLTLFFLLPYPLRRKRLLSSLFAVGCLLYSLLSFFLRLFLSQSAALPLLPFVHTDTVQNLLPSYPLQLPQSPTPLLSLLGLLAIEGLLCLFVWKKEKSLPQTDKLSETEKRS